MSTQLTKWGAFSLIVDKAILSQLTHVWNVWVVVIDIVVLIPNGIPRNDNSPLSKPGNFVHLQGSFETRANIRSVDDESKISL